MKNIVVFVLLSIAFFSCRENQVASDVILEGVELPDKLNERQFARWCMLYCRAADKLFKDMLYAEQLDRALGWYKSHGTAEEQAWIGLYLGRSFVEDKLFIPATKAYSEALDLAKKKHLYNVAGYICSYMADLYTYTGQGSEERRKYEEAADYFKKAGNIRSYAFALRDISITWVFEDSLSLALELMLKADSIVTGMNDSVGIASIANGLGNIYEHLDQIDKAKSYFFRSLAYDTTEQAPTYMALSHMFLNSNLLDSARFYIENTNLKSRNPYVYSDRLYTKYMIEEESNNPLEALQYLEQYCEAQDSLYDVQKQVDIIDAEKRHNSLTVLQQNQKLYSTIYALSGLILVIFLTGILFHLYKDRKRLDKINKQQLLLDEKELLLTKLESEIKQNEIVNLHIVKKETPQIHEKMIQAKKEILMLKCEKLQYSSLFQELKERANDKKKYGQTLSEQDWENLKEQIDSACPNWQTAIQDVETLKKAEIETCYLSFLNISIKSEAMLLGINPDSANKRRLRTRQSLGLTNSKTGIYEFIIRKTLENIVI